MARHHPANPVATIVAVSGSPHYIVKITDAAGTALIGGSASPQRFSSLANAKAFCQRRGWAHINLEQTIAQDEACAAPLPTQPVMPLTGRHASV